MYKLALLLRRARYIFQTEGLLTLLRLGFVFVVERLFLYRAYYLYEQAIGNTHKLNEADFLPKLNNFTFKIISTNQEADELEAGGLEFRRHFINAKERLNKGAVAFCVFCGHELASIGWVAMTEEAKNTLYWLPCRIDFLNGEAYVGQVMTVPKYRRKGLHAYSVFKGLEFLRAKGKKRVRLVVAKSNIASQRALTKLGFKAYAEASYLRFLWWGFWKEKPCLKQPMKL